MSHAALRYRRVGLFLWIQTFLRDDTHGLLEYSVGQASMHCETDTKCTEERVLLKMLISCRNFTEMRKIDI